MFDFRKMFGLTENDTAYSARLIIMNDGTVDLVGDRTGVSGEYAPLLDALNAGSFKQAMNTLQAKLKRGEVTTRSTEEVLLYQDDDVVVRGNPNGSCGYFYLIAHWRKHEEAA